MCWIPVNIAVVLPVKLVLFIFSYLFATCVYQKKKSDYLFLIKRLKNSINFPASNNTSSV